MARTGHHTSQLGVGTAAALEVSTLPLLHTGRGGQLRALAIDRNGADDSQGRGRGTCCATVRSAATRGRKAARDQGDRGTGIGVANPTGIAGGRGDLVLRPCGHLTLLLLLRLLLGRRSGHNAGFSLRDAGAWLQTPAG